jgi:hypothetical protein
MLFEGFLVDNFWRIGVRPDGEDNTKLVGCSVLKTCEISFVDPGGSKHTVEVSAETLFEAAAMALALFKQDGWTQGLGIATRLVIQVRVPEIRHEIGVRQVENWLMSATASPNERLRKQRLRALLEI